MAADHVPQYRPQVAGELRHQRVAACVLHGGAGDRVALQGDRLQHPPRQAGALPGHGAQRRQPAREQPAGGALRLQQRPQREQVVAQRLQFRGAFAAHLEAGERPRQLGPADRRGACVGELGGDHAHAVQRLDQGHLAGVGEGRRVQPRERPTQPLAVELEEVCSANASSSSVRSTTVARERRSPRPIRTSHWSR